MTTPEQELAWEMTAQTLGSKTLYDHRHEYRDVIRRALDAQENQVRKAILVTYLSTPIEKRGRLDINGALNKFSEQIAKAEWDERLHPRDRFGHWVDNMSITSRIIGLRAPRYKVVPVSIPAPTTNNPNNTKTAFRIVHDETSKFPAAGQEPPFAGSENQNRAVQQEQVDQYHREQLAIVKRQLNDLGPEGYLKERLDVLKRRYPDDPEVWQRYEQPPGATSWDIKFGTRQDNEEPAGWEQRKSAVISDFLGVVGMPSPTDKKPGQPVHNLLANIRDYSSRMIGGAQDENLKREMNQKTWGGKALKAGAVLYGTVAPSSKRQQARALNDFANAYADDAGKQLTRYYFRYGGLTRKPGPDMVRGKDARGRKIDETNDVSFRRRLYAKLATELPDENAAKLVYTSGAVPPSEGYIIAPHGGKVMWRNPVNNQLQKVPAEGQVLYQSLGKANDKYLPFNLTALTGLKGGGWSVRRRTWGGPTTEDLHIGLLTGASGVGVVSRHGIYEVQFTELIRRSKNRMGPEHVRMLNSYENILKAIRTGDVRDDRGQVVRLNNQGYTMALEALKSEYPWYIKSVTHTKAAPDIFKTKGGFPKWNPTQIAEDDEDDVTAIPRGEEFENAIRERLTFRGNRPAVPQQPMSGPVTVTQRPADIGSVTRVEPAASEAWRSATEYRDDEDGTQEESELRNFLRSEGYEVDTNLEMGRALVDIKNDPDPGPSMRMQDFFNNLSDELESDENSRLRNETTPDYGDQVRATQEGMDREDEANRRIQRVIDIHPDTIHEDTTTSEVREINSAIDQVTRADLDAVSGERRKEYLDHTSRLKSRIKQAGGGSGAAEDL